MKLYKKIKTKKRNLSLFCLKENASKVEKKGRNYIINNATYPILADKFIKALGGDSK
ncbi:hypothetical protein HF883_07470 [Cloacibacillus porcorum]|uniref:hypothetical protein n=1 Tax=Cloacibacillus porcorum TaxID=1197717 RepID=UPI001459655E|nr:hypothetical protein [Cloacibacillus porcorum]MCC8184604.1 hypothetical protein [Cloacibacillus porcorum]MDY5390936.1 hypothetical protein [Cloacibacillus porcorum]NMF18064.1 hypothetical protein [Cloacibacillus porcorum]